MRVLTDWATGKPPCKGWWLSCHETEQIEGVLRYFDGKRWCFLDDVTLQSVLQNFHWRGLAFNPESASATLCAWNDRPAILIEEFTR